VRSNKSKFVPADAVRVHQRQAKSLGPHAPASGGQGVDKKRLRRELLEMILRNESHRRSSDEATER
jgi:hypothetical protein